MIEEITFKLGARPLPELPKPEDLLGVIIVDALPSLNDCLYLSPKGRAQVLQRERQRGYTAAINFARFLNIPTEVLPVKGKSKSFRAAFRLQWARYLTAKKIFCFCRIYRGASKSNPLQPDRTRDIYNPALKSFIDGFTDAGVWRDDSERYHQNVWFHYGGVLDFPQTEIEFYGQ